MAATILQDPRRPFPQTLGSERDLLNAWLEFQRTTLVLKCEGLGPDDLRARPVATSLLSLHGLVRHLAEVEQTWFVRVLAGRPDDAVDALWGHPSAADDLDLPADASFADDLATWHRQCAVARDIAAAHALDDTGERHGRTVSLRWILIHMIEEYARHNGHADLIRELIDGTVGA